MEHKVVINRQFGAFGLSRKARSIIAKRLNLSVDDVESRYEWSDPSEGFRHCPVLVQVVEELGGLKAHRSWDSAGADSKDRLSIVKLRSHRYIIQEYDGAETCRQPETICWIDAKVEGVHVTA